MEAFAEIVRKGDRFGAAVELDGLLGLVDDHGTILAVLEVALQLQLHGGIEIAVDVVRELADNPFAVQFRPPGRK